MMRVVQNTILAITSILLSYLAIETAWRLYYFHTLKLDVIAKLSAKSHSIYHPEMGYTYIPNQTVALAHWPHFHVNKWGIIDDDDYPVEKPADEYRIVIIGDSFTAGVMNTVRWPALLQEKLNQSPIWRRIVNNKSTRVINFGRDGIGLVQFDKVLLLDGLKFTPDLI